jgi:N-acetylmuramoyl-L-alanine amidase
MARSTVLETDLQFTSEPGVRGRTDFIVVHHTGGNAGDDYSAAEIHAMHQSQGYSGIGYHYVIRKDGTIESGRPRQWVGAHCIPNNRDGIGIHVGGNFMEESPTEEQMASLVTLCADLCDTYGLTPDAIVGHRDKDQTACPGDNLYALLPEVREKVGVA